jgi:hypothetical protein
VTVEIAGILRLPFAHHVDHLDAAQNDTSAHGRLEAKHWPDAPLDGAMILLNTIIEVGTLADANGL